MDSTGVGGGRHRTAALVLATIALVAVVRLPSFVHQLFDPDEAAIAAQAISVRDGGTLYVDAVDRKPPLPPLIYAVTFDLTGTTDLRPLHALAAVGLAGAALVLAFDARRRWGEFAAWWASGLTVLGAVAFFPVDAQAANFAHLALFPGAAAIVWSRRGRPAWALAGGVALGIAVLCRQSWFVGIVPGVVGVLVAPAADRHDRADDDERPWSTRILDAGLFVLGALATVAAVGLVVPFSDFWRWTFTNNSGFVTAGAALGATLGRFGATVGTFVGFHLPLVAMVAVAAWTRLRHWRDRRAWTADVDLWLWLVVGLVSVVAGFRFFGHYWLQVLPPAVLLAVPVASRLSERVRPWAIGLTALPAAACVVFAFFPSAFRTLPDPAPLVAFVEDHTEPGDGVFIWGNFPEVYWQADRAPGGGLVHSDFVTGLSGGRDAGPETREDATPGAEELLLDNLRAHPPALVLDTSSADLRRYGAYPLSDFPAIEAFVREHYRKVGTTDGVDVWARR